MWRSMTWLQTRTGSVNLGDSKVRVVEGGALKVERPSGNYDLISPAYWLAVLDDGSPLEWESLVPQPPGSA